jgi:hypothetical protein
MKRDMKIDTQQKQGYRCAKTITISKNNGSVFPSALRRLGVNLYFDALVGVDMDSLFLGIVVESS